MVSHVFGEVGFLGRGEGAHVAFKGSDVAVRHDVPLKVAAVHCHVVTVPTLTRLFRGAVLGHVTQ